MRCVAGTHVELAGKELFLRTQTADQPHDGRGFFTVGRLHSSINTWHGFQSRV